MSKNKTKIKRIRILLPSILVVAWLAFAGFGGQYFEKISEQSSTDLTTFLPSNADATKVNNLLGDFKDKKSIPAVIVYENDGELLAEQDIDQIKDASTELANIEQVAGKIAPPIVSEDEKAAIVVVPMESDGDFKTSFTKIRATLSDAVLPFSFTISGPASFARDLQDAFSGIDSTLLFVALSVVFLILLVVYRSPLLPFIVLLSAIAALSVAVFVVHQMAVADIVQLNGQVQGILFILVIGAATDYSLLYIARYREELVDHKDKWDATWSALKSSYEPIIAAGGTVTAGLLCLLLSDLGSNRALGPVGGLGVGLSILATLTLLPSMLLLLGRSVFWPRKPKFTTGKPELHYVTSHPVWARIGEFVRHYPRRIWVGSTVVLLIACIGVFQLRAEGVAQSNLVLGASEAVAGQKIIDAHFPAGSGSPALVIVANDQLDSAVEMLDADKGVASVALAVNGVESGVMPIGNAGKQVKAEIKQKIASERDKELAGIRETVDEEMAALPVEYRDAAYMPLRLPEYRVWMS